MPKILAQLALDSATNFPPFVEVDVMDDGWIELTVRAEPHETKFKPARASAKEQWLVVGNQATIRMQLKDFLAFLRQLSDGLENIGI